MSAILSRTTSSSFVCLVLGGAFVQLSVLFLLSLIGGCNLAVIASSVESTASAEPFALGGDRRSFDDLECSSLFSSCDRTFAGVLSA